MDDCYRRIGVASVDTASFFVPPRPASRMDGPTPPAAVDEHWREVADDAEETAAEYREAGWETLVVHPGDVTPRDGDPYGLDVLAPGSEFEALQELVADVTFDTSHVYRADHGGVRFFIVANEATADQVAVVVPAYLADARADGVRERALEEGVMYTHVRPLSADARVTFAHEDPELFF